MATTTGLSALQKRLKNRRLPDVSVPQTQEDELSRALQGIKEHLRMYEGDSNAPRERFVTMQELADSGLITADVKNKFAFISQVQGQDVVQAGGTAAGSARTVNVTNNTTGATELDGLTDAKTDGAAKDAFLKYSGTEFQTFFLFAEENTWLKAQRFEQPLRMQERAATPAALGGLGYLWVKDDAPNTLWFTDDAGTAFQVAGAGLGYLSNIVEDVTPQLGATLDANSFNIDMGTNVITDTAVGQWITAYGWGDHSGLYVVINPVSIDFTEVVGAKALWYGVEDASGYFTGIENGTLYHGAQTYHRWYLATASDGGVSDVMELSSTTLALGANISLANANSKVGYALGAGSFTYDSDSLAHYGMSTYNDSVLGGVATSLSGYYGLRFFRTGVSKGYLDATGWTFEDDVAVTGILTAQEAGGDKVTIDDTGTVARISTNTNALTIIPKGVTSVTFENTETQFRWGRGIRILDAAENSDLLMDHGGTDMDFTFSTTADWNITGITNFNLLAGADTLIFGPTNAGYTQVYHDDTHGYINSSTGSFRIHAAGALEFGVTGDYCFTEGSMHFKERAAANTNLTAYGQIWVKDDVPNTLWFRDDAGTNFQLGVAGGGGSDTPWSENHDAAGYTLTDVSTLSILNGTDSATFSHNGTDFETAFTATVNWDISGGTRMRLQDMNIRIDSAGSAAANPIDHYIDNAAANRVIERMYDAATTTRRWSWIHTTTDALQLLDESNNIHLQFDQGARIRIRDGMQLRMYGAGDVKYFNIQNDDTDVNLLGSGLTDFNITGFTDYKIDNSLFITEKASANADTAAQGQFWVKTATPNVPMYTDDAGGDQLIDPSVSEVNEQNGNYTLVLGDKGKTIRKASGGNGETFTIPANGSVAYPIGTLIGIENDGGGVLTIAITTDTLYNAADGDTGSRAMGNLGSCVIQKIATTAWKLAGQQIT